MLAPETLLCVAPSSTDGWWSGLQVARGRLACVTHGAPDAEAEPISLGCVVDSACVTPRARTRAEAEAVSEALRERLQNEVLKRGMPFILRYCDSEPELWRRAVGKALVPIADRILVNDLQHVAKVAEAWRVDPARILYVPYARPAPVLGNEDEEEVPAASDLVVIALEGEAPGLPAGITRKQAPRVIAGNAETVYKAAYWGDRAPKAVFVTPAASASLPHVLAAFSSLAPVVAGRTAQALAVVPIPSQSFLYDPADSKAAAVALEAALALAGPERDALEAAAVRRLAFYAPQRIADTVIRIFRGLSASVGIRK
jgi:hypothetical protein